MVCINAMAGVGRRLKVWCITCSFAPDDLFFPVLVTTSIKGTWFLFSFTVCLSVFFQPGCTSGISTTLAVSVIGFACLQLLAFVHKLVLLLASARGSIREPSHACIRELLLTAVGVYVVELVWGVYSVVAVLNQITSDDTLCERLRDPVTAYVVLVWLNWLELSVLALVYFSCLDRCKCFCCRAVCSLRFRSKHAASQTLSNNDSQWNVEANIRVIPTSSSISASHLCSLTREKICTCRRHGLNNSKNIAMLDLTHALEVLFRDMEVHYTALDRLSGWILVQKYHSQLLKRGDSLVTEELLKATLRFLTKKGVINKDHVIRQPQPLKGDNNLPETLLHYFWFAMAAYGWPVKVFLEPLSGTCTLCRGARCSWCVGGCGEQEVDRVEENRGAVFLKSAEVASIAGINVDDVVLGKTSNDIHCPPFFVCRTTRHDKVTGEVKKEVVITIRGTLSVKEDGRSTQARRDSTADRGWFFLLPFWPENFYQLPDISLNTLFPSAWEADVMTDITASMRDATKCQESLVEKWFLMLVKTKLTFLGVQDAYFHTGFYKSAKVILNILRKSTLFRDLVEEQHYRLVVVGHSLGAGVGAVLTLLIKQKHPHWADGLHAYLYSVPGAVCSYELAEKAEELGIITSVVGAYDLVSRTSWRALTYLKLLVKKALAETDLKKQEILFCGNFPNWNPPIFGGDVYPVGLIDEQSGAATVNFIELQDSLPVVRRSTWDPEPEKERKQETVRKSREEARNVEPIKEEDEDVEYQERRRSEVKSDSKERQKDCGELLVPALPQPHSKEKRGKDAQAERIATEFLEEDTHLGPLMFIPGRVLHIEEVKETGSPTRWCGVNILGIRCCGIRCKRDRQVQASWKAREDMTGIILHRDCLVDHSPRRLFAMLNNLVSQTEPPIPLGEHQIPQSPTEPSHSSLHPPIAETESEQPAVVLAESNNRNTSHHEHIHSEDSNTVTVEVYDHSEL